MLISVGLAAPKAQHRNIMEVAFRSQSFPRAHKTLTESFSRLRNGLSFFLLETNTETKSEGTWK